MSSSGSHAMSNSNSINSELYRPSNSNDPGWKYGRLTNKNDTNTIKCLLCNQTNKGGINRLKNHLAGIKGNIRKCPKADPEVQREIREYLETLKKKQEDKKRAREDLTADVNIIGEGYESEELEIGSKRSRLKKPVNSVNLVKDKGSWKQQVIKDTYGKDLRDKVNDFLAFWVYKRGISFNSLTDPAFLRFCEAVGQYGSGYKPPTVYEYRMPLLQRQVAKTIDSLQPHKEVWAKTGCTLMTDAWTDRKNRSLMNLCVNSERGTVFLKAIDASSESHTAEYILDFVESGVKEVGEENVLHVVTDNAAANMKAAELFMEKHPRIYWTSCAAHSIDLMLERISKQKEISDAIRQAKEITNFIYNHHQVLSLMRVHTDNKDIVRPGATRFATSFLTLDSISQKKSQLRRFFLSDEYTDLIESSKKKKKKFSDKARKMSDVVSTNNFWKSVALATKVFLPLVLLLRIVDGEEKQPMGFVYGGLKDAIKEIKAAFRYNEDVFEPYVKAIFDGMKGRLDQELHKAAYYLNPYYFYRDFEEIKTDPSIMDAISNCVVRFYPDPKVQDIVMTVEMRNFQNSIGQFAKPMAKRHRDTNDEAFNPGLYFSFTFLGLYKYLSKFI